jgi:ABC-type xylose transport system permease subunit
VCFSLCEIDTATKVSVTIHVFANSSQKSEAIKREVKRNHKSAFGVNKLSACAHNLPYPVSVHCDFFSFRGEGLIAAISSVFIVATNFMSCCCFSLEPKLKEKKLQKQKQNKIQFFTFLLCSCMHLCALVVYAQKGIMEYYFVVVVSIIIKKTVYDDDAWRRFVWWLPCSYKHFYC